MPSIKSQKERRQEGGHSNQKPKPKAVTVKAYLTKRQWLLSLSKADAEMLGLQPFTKYSIEFKGASQ